ncbi:cytochrome P450 [Steroidobacter agaridevorans]|uniref:Cytochrome P450 n=1 Tax=Steroidobacter agaridevorans TaxID=2695856 RepID=A0A829YGL1_9GAMM|nr:cytochrome P450 [Steroidobacter agaridevorans]GFE82053.1 cytochrome P450 [Steroidobacter agaridevorans]GFE85558.1 cytochrome P450 [Steroidobacter agaridevorans]
MRAATELPHSDLYGGFHVVTRHADLRTAAAQHRIYSSAQGIALPNESRTRHVPAEVDPPLQREFRRLLDPFLTPERISANEAKVRAIASSLLDSLAGESRVEMVARFTEPFPVSAALAIFGFPPPDARRLSGLVDGLIHGRGSEASIKASQELTDYLIEQLKMRAASADPSTDVLAAVAHGSVEGRPLSIEDQVSITRLLLFGGFTTVNLALSQTLLLFAKYPELAEGLRSQPELFPTALEEFVRYASPATYLRRTVVAEAELGGSKLRAGDQVLLCFGAANRDPSVFDKPDEINLARNPNPHVGFGFGAHRCLGSAIAKLELRVALEEILRRYERVELDPDDSIAWGEGETQGLTRLPLVLRPRASA